MDIMQIIRSYTKGANPDAILAMIKECDPEARASSNGGYGLMHIACRNAHPEAVEYLLQKGLDPNEPPRDYGDPPIFSLAQIQPMSGYEPRPGDIYKATAALLDARASTMRKDDNEKLSYHYAAQYGNHEFLQAFLDKGVKLLKTDGNGNTGLHLIVEATYNPLRDLEKAKEALAKKKADEKSTPLSLAELQARVRKLEDKLQDFFKCAVIFIEAGVDALAQNNMLETAHKLAVRRGAKKIAALLDGSYSPDDEDNPEAEARLAAGGMTLHQAVRQHDAEAVRAIVAAGSDVNSVSDDEGFKGLTPLAVACLTCDYDMAALLLELGADPNFKDGGGSPGIAYMFTNFIDINLGNVRKLIGERLPKKMVQLMVDKGFYINSSVSDVGETLLGLASRSEYGGGGRDSVKAMVVSEAIRCKADVNKPNIHGQTPLMVACTGSQDNNEDILISLLEAGADASMRDAGGNTALHYAAACGSQRSAQVFTELLFDMGEPDTAAVNNDGKTALDYAVAGNNEPLAKLLLMKS